MKKIKEFRIDSLTEPFLSEHLIINSNGNVVKMANGGIKAFKISKKDKFFKELDSALTLDLKMMSHYVNTPNYYHISVIFEDDTEESHFYIDDLESNNQLSLKSVLIRYLDSSVLTTVINNK